MKTKLPLPTETKLQNDKPVKSYDERLGYPFYYTRIYDAPLYESDLKYINNVIKSDKIYRMIVQAHNRWENTIITNNPDNLDEEKRENTKYISSQEDWNALFVEQINCVCFFSKFLNDPKSPVRVKKFLYKYIGEILEAAKCNGDYNDLKQRSFLAERWMEICR